MSRADHWDLKNPELTLTMPVLAVGGEKSFGPLRAAIMRNVATNIQEAVVAGSGHWLMEEPQRKRWRSFATSSTLRKLLQEPAKTPKCGSRSPADSLADET